MDMYTILERFGAAWRQQLILETAYPCLPEKSAIWMFLPGGRPVGMSAEGRYVLFAYRAAQESCERYREWLLEHEADAWVAAVEAETRFLWEYEYAQLLDRDRPWIPIIPELEEAVALAVA